jgi:NAD(P)-dependent dehydrogenase (short-subunit alcohol dehydrogenase family)
VVARSESIHIAPILCLLVPASDVSNSRPDLPVRRRAGVPEPFDGQRAFSQSKLANVMFSYELARRLDNTGVTATVCHPSWCTSFGAEDQAAHSPS